MGVKPLEEVAPGNLLQKMHLKRRLQKLFKQGDASHLNFIDAGAGKGHLSNFFLQLGLSGVGCDLNPESCARNKQLNSDFISKGRYRVFEGSFLTSDFGDERFDFVFSSMVLAHLPPDGVDLYFKKFSKLLKDGGLIITITPGSMAHWGIEDETVGHFKRYSFKCYEDICVKHGLTLNYICGLTYPISNWLLPISNALIRRDHRGELNMSKDEQTRLSGNRFVRLKHIFPWYFKLFLNEVTMYPFDLLQRLFRKHPSSMVIYSEIGVPLGRTPPK